MLKYILSFCYHLKKILTTIIVVKRKKLILNQICFFLILKCMFYELKQ